MRLPPSSLRVNVPRGMQALPHWLTHLDKKPVAPARVNDPTTWGTFDAALVRLEAHPQEGLGFAFTSGCGLTFIDLDHCLDSMGLLREWAVPVVQAFNGKTYMERSPSGTGLHIFAVGTPPWLEGRRGATSKVPHTADGRVEVYVDGRYSTVTGEVYLDSGALGRCAEGLDRLAVLFPDLVGTAPIEEPEKVEVTPEVLAQRDAEARAALAQLDPDCSHEAWLRVGMALHDGLGARGFKLWNEWSAKGRKYKPGECGTRWRSFKAGGGVRWASLFFWASEEGERPKAPPASTPEEDFAEGAPPPAGTPEEDFKAPDGYAEGSVAEWRRLGLHLTLSGAGKNTTVRPTEGESNIILWLERGGLGTLAFNERTRVVELNDKPVDYSDLLHRAQWFLAPRRTPSRWLIEQAVLAVAQRNSYDPVARWLKSLTWDGKARLDHVCASARLEDEPITRRMMRRWLIGAVARAMRPGCEMQTMLVLFGPQGYLKSKFFKALATRPEWYTETTATMGTKDGQLALIGPWLVEHAEMGSMSRADIEHIKAHISEASTDFRVPYGRHVEKHPRRNVLCATTNQTHLLRDGTGSRRFWLIGAPKPLDLRWLEGGGAEQVWAEAVRAYDAGERWWDNVQEAEEVQARNEGHEDRATWEVALDVVVPELPSRCRMADIMERLRERLGNLQGVRERDIAEVLRKLGWKDEQTRVAGVKARWWVAPPPAPGEVRPVIPGPGSPERDFSELL